MKKLLPVAQLIYSCWILSDDDDSHEQSIPTSAGILDHALHDLVEGQSLPTWAAGALHFVVTNSGLTCLELPQIQQIATEAKLTSNPNPSYTRSDIEVSPLVARRCLSRLKVPEDRAKLIGKSLRSAVTKAETKLGLAVR
jgi:hypothetical protein